MAEKEEKKKKKPRPVTIQTFMRAFVKKLNKKFEQQDEATAKAESRAELNVERVKKMQNDYTTALDNKIGEWNHNQDMNYKRANARITALEHTMDAQASEIREIRGKLRAVEPTPLISMSVLQKLKR